MGKLHDAALEVFSKRGYHAARVDDIVRAAKTSHGTFYLYFSNKEDLFRSLVADVVEEMTSVAVSLGPVGPGPDGYEEIRSWLERFSDLYDRHGAILRAWTEAEAYDAEFGGLATREASRFTEVLARRLAESGHAVTSPEVAAVAITAMVERFNYYRVSRGLEVDKELALEAMARMIHTGCFLPGPMGQHSGG